VASNWAGFAVNALVILGLTPFVLAQLGVERYGIWILINSFIGYYGLLDFGFRAGVNQFLIRTVAAKDFNEANIVFSSAVAALAGLGIIIALLTIVGMFFAPDLLDIADSDRREAVYSIAIVGLAAAIQVLFSPFGAVFVAKQRFDLLNLVAISMRLTSAALTIICLYMGFGLPGLAAAAASSTVGGCLLHAIIARRILPSLVITLKLVKLEKLRGIGSFGLWNFLIAVTDYVYLSLLPILVAAFMPLAAVGHYALAAGLWHELNRLFSPIGQVLYPVAAEMHVKDEILGLQRLYVDGTRLILLVVLPATMLAAVWAEDFYFLWVGGEFLSGDPFIPVSTLLRVMLIGSVFGYTANIAGQSLIAAGHVRSIAILKFFGALTTVAISIALIGNLGLIAIALAACTGIFLCDVVGTSMVLKRLLGLRFSQFLRRSLVPLSLTGVALFTINKIIHSLWEPNTWSRLLTQGGIAGCCSLLVVLFIGLTGDERRDLIVKPLSKLRGRVFQSTK
jgi:O-antigen/teichoic acid export membrane protein